LFEYIELQYLSYLSRDLLSEVTCGPHVEKFEDPCPRGKAQSKLNHRQSASWCMWHGKINNLFYKLKLSSREFFFTIRFSFQQVIVYNSTVYKHEIVRACVCVCVRVCMCARVRACSLIARERISQSTQNLAFLFLGIRKRI
jgi:hypothetical protein